MFPASELAKLLQHNKHLIGAPVRLKDPNRTVHNYGKVLDDSQKPLLKVERIGCAVMLISKQLALDIAQECQESGDYYFHDPNYTRGEQLGKIKIYDCFKVGVYEGEYLSEDYYFCRLAQKLGYNIYVDISCKTIHNGIVSLSN